jgi:transcriptional regulator with XRE-family HTH domain
MSTIHENIMRLCEESGIKPGKMCSDLGMSRSLMTDLKAGRKKSVSLETAQKIADYFGVTVKDLLNGTWQGNMMQNYEGYKGGREDERRRWQQTEKAPPVNGDAELEEIIFQMETRPDMKLLFNRMKNATDAELKAIAVAWDALNKRGES